MNEAMDRMYRWYRLGCRLNGTDHISLEEFEQQHLLQALNEGILSMDLFKRTSAEWELAREDAVWTTVLQRLANMNLSLQTSDLVAAIRAGRELEDGGETGSAGVTAGRLPFMPVLSGAGAKLHPALDPEPEWRDP